MCFPAPLRLHRRFLSLGRVQQTCWKATSVQRRGFRAKLRRPAKLKDLTSAGNIDIDAESVTASLRPQLDGLVESASKLAITTRPIFCTLTQPSLLVLQICTLSDPRPQSRLAAIHRIGGWKDSPRFFFERFSLRCQAFHVKSNRKLLFLYSDGFSLPTPREMIAEGKGAHRRLQIDREAANLNCSADVDS